MLLPTDLGEAGRALLRALEPLASTDPERARVLRAAISADDVAEAEQWARARRAEGWGQR